MGNKVRVLVRAVVIALLVGLVFKFLMAWFLRMTRMHWGCRLRGRDLWWPLEHVSGFALRDG